METENEVEKLIIKALKELSEIGTEDAPKLNQEPRLIFPKTQKTKTLKEKRRVSEQELRFLLTRKLEAQDKFYYSVETPTKNEYSFSSEGSRSGNIDLCLHNSIGERICLIELKCKTVDTIRKDFEKLLYEQGNEMRYFVHFVESCNKGTIPTIKKKYEIALEEIKEEKAIRDKKESNVKIILYVMGDKNYLKYEIDSQNFILQSKGQISI